MPSTTDGSQGKAHPTTNPGADGKGKKRKGWARTVNVSHSNTALSGMTSENFEAEAVGMSSVDAREYMEHHQAHVNRLSSFSDSGGTPGEVKISFGPSRPPAETIGDGKSITINGASMSAAASIAAAMGAAAVTTGSGMTASSSIDFGDLDLDAFKERAGATASGQKAFRNKQGIPCTEAEMKALMGMFVEIMGMSVNGSNGLGGTTTSGTVSTSGKESSAAGDMADAKAAVYAASMHGPIFDFGMHHDNPQVGRGDAKRTSPNILLDYLQAVHPGKPFVVPMAQQSR